MGEEKERGKLTQNYLEVSNPDIPGGKYIHDRQKNKHKNLCIMKQNGKTNHRSNFIIITIKKLESLYHFQ